MTLEQLIDYGEIIGSKNLSPGISGNISLRVDGGIFITTSGSAIGNLSLAELVKIDFEGNSLEKKKKPSSEKMLHVEFYKKRPDINAIIHVHPPFLSAFAAARKPLDEPFMAEIVYYFGKIPLADYGLPSSADLVEKTVKYFDEFDAVLMANHGFIVGACDLKSAYDKLELAEVYAQTVINAKILGGAVALSSFEVEQINSLK